MKTKNYEQNNKNKFYFSNKEIALISTFLVMLLIGECVWFAGPSAEIGRASCRERV